MTSYYRLIFREEGLTSATLLLKLLSWQGFPFLCDVTSPGIPSLPSCDKYVALSCPADTLKHPNSGNLEKQVLNSPDLVSTLWLLLLMEWPLWQKLSALFFELVPLSERGSVLTYQDSALNHCFHNVTWYQYTWPIMMRTRDAACHSLAENGRISKTLLSVLYRDHFCKDLSIFHWNLDSTEVFLGLFWTLSKPCWLWTDKFTHQVRESQK